MTSQHISWSGGVLTSSGTDGFCLCKNFKTLDFFFGLAEMYNNTIMQIIQVCLYKADTGKMYIEKNKIRLLYFKTKS